MSHPSSSTLEGHTAVITGASRGIGRACAVSLAEAGSDLCLISRSRHALEQTAEQCSEFGVNATVAPADVSDFEALKKAIADYGEKTGHIDILVNNAGQGISEDIRDASLDRWDEVIDVNLKAVYRGSRYALAYMTDTDKHRAIINIASIAGKMSFAGGGAYCSSKHGVVGLTGSLFEDVREEGIKVSAICPGYVDTEFVAGRDLEGLKMIQPEDVARTAMFVATYPDTGCPTEIKVRPQRSPYT